MLLRHGNDSLASLRQFGVSIEEFTRIQPIASKYDYLSPARLPVSVVAVVANDLVYGVYRITGIEASGTNYTIVSDAYKAFEAGRDIPVRNCHRFGLESLPSACVGLPVQGWESRTRTPVQRFGGSFFDEVHVGSSQNEDMRTSIEQAFHKRVEASLAEAPETRQVRLAKAISVPTRLAVATFVFSRNPDVVAEALIRANGICQACKRPAPFARRSDGSPYLEVHHKIPLANGGVDTVENAIAVCPNCHRRAHYA